MSFFPVLFAVATALLFGLAQGFTGNPQYVNSRFTLEWKLNANQDVISFRAVSPGSTGHVAVGFAPDTRFHRQGDAFAVWPRNGQCESLDGFSTRRSQPATDGRQDYTVISCGVENGATVAEFSRPVRLTDNNDFNLEGTGRINVFWAVGGTGRGTTYPEHRRFSRFQENILGTANVDGGGGGGPPPAPTPKPIAPPVQTPAPIASGGPVAGPAIAVKQFTSSQISVGWEYEEGSDFITFEATADVPAGSYISIGFTEPDSFFHTGGDCFTGFIDGSTKTGLDGYSDFQAQPDEDDDQSAYQLLDAFNENGKMTIIFTRKVKSDDVAQDMPDLSSETEIFWAIGRAEDRDFLREHTDYDSFCAQPTDPNAPLGCGGGGLFESPDVPLFLATIAPLIGAALFSITKRAGKSAGYAPPKASQALAAYDASEKGSRHTPQAQPAAIPSNFRPKSLEPLSPLRLFLRQRIYGEINVLEALVLASIAGISVAFVYLFPPEKFKDLPELTWGYVAIVMSFLCVLPAMRNSIITLLVQAPFERTIVYHRWLGRFTVAAAAIHSAMYIAQWINEDTLEENLDRYIDGVLSMLFLLIVFLTSFAYVRRKWYNSFHIAHFSFFGFFAFGVIHTKDTGSFALYAILAGIVYGVDIIMRYSLSLFPHRVLEVKTLPEGVVRVRFPKSQFKTYRVGQYVFLSFPALSVFEWHPYTLSSSPSEPFLEVHIKALGDHTTRLFNKVAKNPSSQHMTVRVDGPYGRVAFNYKRYEHLLLVGGGIGITPLASVIKDIFISPPGGVAPPYLRTVYLIWTVQTEESWRWFMDMLTAALKRSKRNPNGPRLIIEGHVTRPGRNLRSLQNYITSAGGPGVFSIDGQRADVRTSMDRLQRECFDAGPNRVGTLTCGPEKLVNSVWDNCQARTAGKITYDCHKEVFTF